MITPLNVFLLLVAIASYLVLASALLRAAQPLRLRLADIGEYLLVDPNLPRPFKRHVRFCLDTAFGMKAPLMFGLFAAPVLAIIYVVRARWIAPLRLDPTALGRQNRESFDELVRLHNKITLANNPILMTLFGLEATLCMSIAVLIRAFVKGKFPQADDNDLFMFIVEDKSAMIADRFRHNHAT